MPVVRDYMTPAPSTARPGDPIEALAAQFSQGDLSSFPVMDDGGALIGVISRSDLLRVGVGGATELLDWAGRTVAYGMSAPAVTTGPDATLSEAATLMVEKRIHRLYVLDEGALIGVISTRDLMRAVEDARIKVELERYMTQTVICLDCEAPVSEAMTQLSECRISGVVVTETDWPVGLFTHAEALEAHAAPPETEVGELMTPAMICVDTQAPLHRAAAMATTLAARRIIAVHGRHVRGIVTGMDFARAVIDAKL